MEERRDQVFDASAYMLFEATGDSEAEYFDAAFDQESDAAEDDAQSCSYSCSSGLHEADYGADDFRGMDFDYRSGQEDEDDGDEEDGVVDQCCRRNRTPAAEATKSKGFEESNSNVMKKNEREGDKLFWEACLAS